MRRRFKNWGPGEVAATPRERIIDLITDDGTLGLTEVQINAIIRVMTFDSEIKDLIDDIMGR